MQMVALFVALKQQEVLEKKALHPEDTTVAYDYSSLPSRLLVQLPQTRTNHGSLKVVFIE